MTIIRTGLLCIGLLAASAAIANEAGESPAQQAIEYRDAMYHVLAWNFGAMTRVVKGEAPYNKEQFAVQAARVAYLAPMLTEGFPPGSYIAGKTDAKPLIWEQRAEFDGLLKKLANKTSELADVAKSGDLAKIKPAVQETGQVCKECHKKFKKD